MSQHILHTSGTSPGRTRLRSLISQPGVHTKSARELCSETPTQAWLSEFVPYSPTPSSTSSAESRRASSACTTSSGVCRKKFSCDTSGICRTVSFLDEYNQHYFGLVRGSISSEPTVPPGTLLN